MEQSSRPPNRISASWTPVGFGWRVKELDQGLDELAATFAAVHFVSTPARQPTQLTSEVRFGQVQDVTRPSTQGEIRTRTPLRGSGGGVRCRNRRTAS